MPNLPLALIYLIFLAVSIQLHSKHGIPENTMQTDLPYCCLHPIVKFESWIKNLRQRNTLYEHMVSSCGQTS